MDKCKLVIRDGYLLLTMPSGEIIPMQSDIKISQDMETSLATITVHVDTTSIENKERNVSNN